MSAHTPGPWMQGPTDGIGQRGRLIVVDATGAKVADCEADKVDGGLNFTRPLPEDTANARLIAMAPDLLSKLREIHSGMVCSCHLEHYVDGPVPCVTCQIGAVVAKAEGQT